MSPNKLNLDLTGNEELREAMADMAPGDEAEMELVVKLDESTGEQAQFSVVEANLVEAPEEEAEEVPGIAEGTEMGEGESFEESEAEPVAAAGRKGKRAGTVAIMFGGGR